MNRPTRRRLLAGVASVAIAGGVLPVASGHAAEHPDAKLIAVCAEHRRIHWAFEAYYDTLPDGNIDDDDPAWAMLDPVDALVEQIVALRATTAEGHLARGRALAFHYLPHHPSLQDDPDGAFSDRAQAAALRDLVSIERGTATPVATLPAAVEQPKPTHPDADLLAACAAHDELERAYLATGFDHDSGTPEYDTAEAEQIRITAAQRPYVDRICKARPVLWEGHVARARTLALCDPDLFRRASGYANEAMLAAIVRDLLAGEGGA